MIKQPFIKKIFIIIFQLCTFSIYALTPTDGLIETIQPNLDANATLGKAHAVLIDSSWILANPNAPIVSTLKQKIKDAEYGILKSVPLPSAEDVQYNLYDLNQPVTNVSPVARVRTLPSSELDVVIIGRYENHNIATAKKINAFKITDPTGIEDGDIGCPDFWQPAENTNYLLIGFLDSTSTVKPFTTEINTHIDNEIIKQAISSPVISSQEEEKAITPPNSPQPSPRPKEEIKPEEEEPKKEEFTLPKAAGYNATLIDSSWLLTFKSEGENPVGSKVRYSENELDEVTVDKVIDDPDGLFRLLHLNQPIFDQPIKRARLGKNEVPQELFSVSKLFKNTVHGHVFYLRISLKEEEVPFIKKHSSSPTIQRFNEKDILNQQFSTGAGIFLKNSSDEVELYGIAEKKSYIYPLTIAVNTWIDNEIIKQALTLQEKPKEEEPPKHKLQLPLTEEPIQTTITEEEKIQKEKSAVLTKINEIFKNDLYIANYSHIAAEWEKLVKLKKAELDHVTTNSEFVNLLNGWLVDLKEELSIKNYPLSVTVTSEVTTSTSQAIAESKSPLTLSFALIKTITSGILLKTTSSYYAAIIKITDLNNTKLTTELPDFIKKLNAHYNAPKNFNKKLQNGEITNIIIDLRDTQGDNPGILKSALGDLIGSKKLFVIAQSKGRTDNLMTTGTTSIQIKLAKPLVVLVNQNTSGTAEIMAEALSHDGAVIVGTPTADKVDFTHTSKIPALEDKSLSFTYPVTDFLLLSGESLQGLGGVQFGEKDIQIKPNQDAFNQAISYLKNKK